MDEIYQQFFTTNPDFGPEGCLLTDSEDEAEDEDREGHPLETKEQVLENLRKGFPYHKNGPAREYDWNKDEISQMSKMIQEKHFEIKRAKKNKSRVIQAQNYKGETSSNMLLNWVNSCLSGERFPDNSDIKRGPTLEHGEWSNHRLWQYVSTTLQSEFHYWCKVEQINRKLPPEKRKEAKYPKLSDLIFRRNEDFTSGLWSEFSEFWQPFIDEIR